jgi:hypothetical protein
MKKLLILFTVLTALGVSCKSDFLSVNEFNPNNASSVPANLVLPAALNNTARNFTQPDNYNFASFWYGGMSISGGYSQPTNLTQYNLLNSDYQGIWSNAYTNLNNYDYIIKQTTGKPKQQSFEAIAKIMMVYIYQGLVDVYGNIPYSEALKTDKGILKPKYDDQQAIYEDLAVQLDAAMGLITSTPADADEVGSYDIVYNGNMARWYKFANTIKLRLLVNQSDMTGRASYISGAIATTPADYIGIGEGAMANPGYQKSANKMNPFWENFYKQDDSQQADGLGYYVAGQDAADFLTSNNDPRKLRFFQANSANGTTVKGNYFGALLLEPVPTTSKLGPGMLQAYNQDAPLMTDFESLFLQAEAAQRGIIAGDPKALYESAVTESIIYEGGTGGNAASAAAYLAQNGKPLVNFDQSPNKIQTIISQKWMALDGLNPLVVWTDYRRTGFPSFLHFSQDPARLNDTPPVRLLYPQTEISTNNDNVLAQGNVDLFDTKIFWQNR